MDFVYRFGGMPDFFSEAQAEEMQPANNDHEDHGALLATDNCFAAFSAIQNTLIFRSFK
jgi:hypothetical protein